MNLYSHLLNFSLSKLSWLLLLAASSFCLAASIFFQHVLSLNPCVMCIQERMFLIGLWFVGLSGFFFKNCIYMRGVILGGWLLASVGGLRIAVQHLLLQLNPSIFTTCAAQVSFPASLPLHEWFPSIFMAYGACEESVWDFAGLTMVQWVVALFAINTALSLTFVIVELMASVRHEGVWVNGIPSEECDKHKYHGDH